MGSPSARGELANNATATGASSAAARNFGVTERVARAGLRAGRVLQKAVGRRAASFISGPLGTADLPRAAVRRPRADRPDDPAAIYYYVVRAGNACGEGTTGCNRDPGAGLDSDGDGILDECDPMP